MSVSIVQNGVRKVVADTSTMALSNLATIEGTTTASKAYAVGDFLVLTGQLYKVTQAIAQGGTITVGTNVVADNVGSELSAINTHFTELTDSVSIPVTSTATWNDVLPSLFLACNLTKVSGKSYIDLNGTYYHCVRKTATSAIFSNTIVGGTAPAYTVSAVMANGGQAYNILNESTGAITSGLSSGVGFNGNVVLHY